MCVSVRAVSSVLFVYAEVYVCRLCIFVSAHTVSNQWCKAIGGGRELASYEIARKFAFLRKRENRKILSTCLLLPL